MEFVYSNIGRKERQNMPVVMELSAQKCRRTNPVYRFAITWTYTLATKPLLL